jgi:hypothetical protein
MAAGSCATAPSAGSLTPTIAKRVADRVPRLCFRTERQLRSKNERAESTQFSPNEKARSSLKRPFDLPRSWTNGLPRPRRSTSPLVLLRRIATTPTSIAQKSAQDEHSGAPAGTGTDSRTPDDTEVSCSEGRLHILKGKCRSSTLPSLFILHSTASAAARSWAGYFRYELGSAEPERHLACRLLKDLAAASRR